MLEQGLKGVVDLKNVGERRQREAMTLSLSESVKAGLRAAWVASSDIMLN